MHMLPCCAGWIIIFIAMVVQVLTEDILPALDKLRREKVQYMEWQNAVKNLDKLVRFCVAHRYVEAQR